MTQTHTLFTVSTFTALDLETPLRSETPRALRRGRSENPGRAWVTFATFLAVLLLALVLVQPAAALDPALGCQDWSWVGLKEEPDLPCPDPGDDWIVYQLFDDPTGTAPNGVPTLLRNFCYYERPIGPDDGVSILELNGLSDASPACLTVAPASDSLSDVTWPALSEAFALGAGIGKVPLTEATPVRLALLDTAATRQTDVAEHPGNSNHGYSLANMAEALLWCDGQNCPMQLTSRLAMPYLTFDPASGHLSDRDDVNGGYMGTLADLAWAVWSETHDWRRSGALDGQRMILNLSLGWDGELFGGLEEDIEQMPVAVQAVYRALEVASCHGALVVAAAGNGTGGPNGGSGPLLPGAWENRIAPDFDTCLQLGVTPDPMEVPVNPDPAQYRPLIHAVGGVDPAGDPLANARPNAMPRLAALGRHGVAESHLGGEPTATLTGTSVSSLVSSAAAAAVWYYAPELRANEVMQRIYDTAKPLAMTADFHLETGGLAPETRAVSICRAAAATCPAGSQCLGEQPVCLGGTPGFAGLDFSSFLEGVGQVIDGTAINTAFPESALHCAGEVLQYDPAVGLPSYYCPHHQLDGVALEPWLVPQPGSTPCPNCTFDDDENAMFIEIASDYQGTLTNPILIVDTTLYSLDVQPLVAGERAVVQNLSHVVIPQGDEDKVTISFTVETGAPSPSADTSPVLVLP